MTTRTKQSLPETLLGLLLEEHAGPLVVVDPQGTILWANRATHRLLGWTEADLAGKPIAALVPPAMRARHQLGFRRYLETGVAHVLGRPIRVPVLCRNGTELRLEMSLSAHPAAEGDLFVAAFREPRGVVTADRDAAGTDQVRPLEALEKARGFLESPPPRHAVELAQRAAQAAQAFLGGTLIRIWLADSEGGWLRQPPRTRRRGEPLDPLPADVELTAQGSLVAKVARGSQPFVRNELAGLSEFDPGWLQRTRIQALALLPLRQNGCVLGVWAYFSDRPISREMLLVLDLFGSLVSGHLQGLAVADRAATLGLRERELNVVSGMAARVASGEGQETLVPSLLAAACELTGMDAGLVALRQSDDAGMRVMACTGHGSPLAGYQIAPGAGAVSRAVEEGTVVTVADYRSFSSPLPPLRQRGVQSVVAFPIPGDGGVLGALKLEAKAAGKILDAPQQRVIQILANQVALALASGARGKG